MPLEQWATGSQNPQTIYLDGGLIEQPPSNRLVVFNDEGKLEAPKQILSHPAFPPYVLPINPHRVINFVRAPALKVDTNVVRTLASNVAVQRLQVPEDITVTLVWSTSISPVSPIAEMAVTFAQMWVTPLTIGQSVGWQPRDRSMDRFNVKIVGLQVGGQDFDYLELAPDDPEGPFLDTEVRLQLQLQRAVVPPKASVTLVGI